MFANSIGILVVIATVKSAKILVVVPPPIISHQVIFRPMIQELLNRDHEVTVLTTDPIYPQDESPKNLKEIDLQDLSYTVWLKRNKKLANPDLSDLDKIGSALSWLSEIFIIQLKDKSVQNIVNDKTIKFDLLILENIAPATLIMRHIFNAPVIIMSTLGALPHDMEMIGSKPHPLLYPMYYQQKIYNLTTLEKIYALYTNVAYNSLFQKVELYDDKILKNIFGRDTPNLNELKNSIDILFLNVHPIWLHNQPVAPNVIFTWGIHKPTEKNLSKELQSYLDASKHGVIYFSFGSIFKTSEIPPKMLEIFVKVFSRLPYNILRKWDADKLPGKSENIEISKWFPQWDILRHPNLKLLITHGGLRSTSEAINAGVPILGIPQFGDQEYITEKYVYFEIGTKLDYKSMTVETLERAIKKIFENYNSYEKNVLKLRAQMHDQPLPVLEHIMWRIEYLLRHGGAQYLRTPAANMSWTEYYELEIVLLILSGLIVLITILLLTTFICLLRLWRRISFKLNKSEVSVIKFD